jgi:hypothetical protein
VLDNVDLSRVVLNSEYYICDSTIPDYVVPVEHTVTGDISDGPDRLLNYTHIRTLEQLDKQRNSPLVND